MKILIVGSGGREHALAWRLAQSPSVTALYAVPGNPGIASLAQCLSAPDILPQTLLAVAESVDADLTIVGPEAPLVAGVVDAFRAVHRPIVGPDAEAARLEGSKIFAKQLFRELHIPTADFIAVDSSQEARAAIDRFGYPVVIKADGLASGKGVVIATNREESEDALQRLGGHLVIEQYLTGEEVSFIVLSDGQSVLHLEPTQDHKTLNDGDTGPNTGGMGAYCDSAILSACHTREILERVILPVLEHTRFTGFLYAGMMLTADGPKILEFNVRLGDPEAQALMHRLDTDLAELLMAAARSELSGQKISWKQGPSVCVVLASPGYPDSPHIGIPIHGIADAESSGATVFHAGTRLQGGQLETAGGRILGATASGKNLPDAIERTYTAVRKIQFEGMHYRTDIGHKGLRRYNKSCSGT